MTCNNNNNYYNELVCIQFKGYKSLFLAIKKKKSMINLQSFDSCIR